MNTKYITNLYITDVCRWIDENPNAKIIAIASSNFNINYYTIFYQEK